MCSRSCLVLAAVELGDPLGRVCRPPISRSCSQRWVSRYSVNTMTRSSTSRPACMIGSSQARNAVELRVRAVLGLPRPGAKSLQQVPLVRG